MAKKTPPRKPKTPKRGGQNPPLKVGDQRPGERPGAFTGSEPKGSRYQPPGERSRRIPASGSVTKKPKKPARGPLSIGRANPLYKLTKTLGGKK